uniref:Ankyrin repeat domain-containing protein n=1 Tax=Timema tahoe TaxID=61484 RepID=A0A7R9IQ78_9NEOP|nr:unnamed protein product [Timema tahoe]
MDTVAFLQSIATFQERREMVHQAIRHGSLEQVTSMLTPEEGSGAALLAVGKNLYGRCSLHVAVLCQSEEIVQFIANKFPETLRVGDNLERIALHYAMGVDKVETISNILIKAGAKRVLKDLVSPKLVARTLPPEYSVLLKGRQPTYYFMNKSDILRLQDDEESLRG